VVLVGALLGSRRGALCMATYVAQGAIGLPVFAGGTSGLAVLAGPRGGYLLGFIAAAYVTGLLAERGWDRRVGTTLVAMLVGNAAIYALGLPWLAAFVGAKAALPLGLYPFVAGDLLKLALAGLALPSGWKLLGIRRDL
jgi:biotin transport system substrate-specific component